MKINLKKIYTFALLAGGLSGIILFQGCTGKSDLSAKIQKEYLNATNGYLDNMEAQLNRLGDFSLEDKTILKDKTGLAAAKTVVEGTVKADIELFDAMKSRIDSLKAQYADTSPASAEVQSTYDSLAKDFQDLQDLDTERGNAMLTYLDFVIAHSGEITIDGNNVRLESEDLSKKYNELEKTASNKQLKFDAVQGDILDRHDRDFKAFADALAKQ